MIRRSLLPLVQFWLSVICLVMCWPIGARAYTVIGLARLVDTTSHSGITVVAQGTVRESTVTAANGAYTFAALPASFYTFSFSKDGYQPETLADVTVLKDTSLALVTLWPWPDTFTVRGTVHLAGRADHSGIMAVFNRNSGFFRDTVFTDSTGVFTALVVDTGQFSVAYKKTGFRTVTRANVRILRDTTFDTTITLDSLLPVSGIARLRNQTTHDSIAITVRPQGQAIFDSTLTSGNGAYAFGVLDTGRYSFKFRRSGFYPESLVNYHLTGPTVLDTVLLDSILPATTKYHGTISQNTFWSKRSTRNLTGDLTLAAGCTLTIEAGTQVTAAVSDSYRTGIDLQKVEFIINGQLVARGTGTKTIQFLCPASAQPNAWRGLSVTRTGSAVLTNCSFKHGCWGLKADSSRGLTSDSCEFSNNYYGLELTACSMAVRQTSITGNTYTGLVLTRAGIVLEGSTIAANNSSALLATHATVTAFNNVFLHNTLGLDFTDTSQAVFYNNSIVANGTVAVYNFRSRLVMFNNLVAEHTAYGIQNSPATDSANVELGHNSFRDNQANFSNCPAGLGKLAVVNRNADSCDAAYNLFKDPAYMVTGYRVQLKNTSPCRWAGIDTFVSTVLAKTFIVTNFNPPAPDIGRLDSIVVVTGLAQPTAAGHRELSLPAMTLDALLASLDDATTCMVYALDGKCLGTFRGSVSIVDRMPAGLYVVVVRRKETMLPIKTLRIK